MADPPTYLVEIGFEALATDPLADVDWTTITGVEAVSIGSGRQESLGRFEVGTCQLTLDNQDGRFSPEQTDSIYYPNVRPMVRIRITMTFDGDSRELFTGFVLDWLPVVNDNGEDQCQVQCSDMLLIVATVELAALLTTQFAGARVTAVLNEIGWPSADRVIDAGATTMLAIDTREAPIPALQHLEEIMEVEVGIFYVDPQGRAVFEDRSARIRNERSNTAVAVFGGPDGLPYSNPQLQSTAASIHNDVHAVHHDLDPIVDEVTAEDTDSQDKYFKRTLRLDSPHFFNASAAQDWADWRLSRDKEPTPQLRSISLLGGGNDALWAQLRDLRVSDRVTVIREFPGHLGLNRDFWVEGLRRDLTEGLVRHGLQLTLSNADPRIPETHRGSEFTYQLISDVSEDGILAAWPGAVCYDGSQYLYISSNFASDPVEYPDLPANFGGGLARYDTTMDMDDPAAWTFFDGRLLTPSNIVDWFYRSLVFDGQYLYTMFETYDFDTVYFVVYDTTQDFTDPDSYVVTEQTVIDAAFKPQRLLFDGSQYLYVLCYDTSQNTLFRYDTTSPAWDSYDFSGAITNPFPGLTGLQGGFGFDGQYLYWVRAKYVFGPEDFHVYVTRYDTTAALNDDASYEEFEISNTSVYADYVTASVYDGAQFVYFTRGGGFATGSSNWVGRYDTTLPFNDADSYEFINLGGAITGSGPVLKHSDVFQDPFLWLPTSSAIVQYDTRLTMTAPHFDNIYVPYPGWSNAGQGVAVGAEDIYIVFGGDFPGLLKIHTPA